MDIESQTRCFYVIVRPYLRTFLQALSKYFNFYICTAASKPYALQIIKKLDPKEEYFNEKKIFYSENNVKKLSKYDFPKYNEIFQFSIQRSFPNVKATNTIIIDDDFGRWEKSDFGKPFCLKKLIYIFFQDNVILSKKFTPLECREEKMEIRTTNEIVYLQRNKFFQVLLNFE